MYAPGGWVKYCALRLGFPLWVTSPTRIKAGIDGGLAAFEANAIVIGDLCDGATARFVKLLGARSDVSRACGAVWTHPRAGADVVAVWYGSGRRRFGG